MTKASQDTGRSVNAGHRTKTDGRCTCTMVIMMRTLRNLQPRATLLALDDVSHDATGVVGAPCAFAHRLALPENTPHRLPQIARMIKHVQNTRHKRRCSGIGLLTIHTRRPNRAPFCAARRSCNRNTITSRTRDLHREKRAGAGCGALQTVSTQRATPSNSLAAADAGRAGRPLGLPAPPAPAAPGSIPARNTTW